MAHLFVEQLTVLDCSYLCAERGLVGESWIVDLELVGDLDDQGMVLDFGAVKRQVRDAVESVADHRLLVPRQSPALQISESAGRTQLVFSSSIGDICHHSPSNALALLDSTTIADEPLRTALLAAAWKTVPGNVRDIRIHLRHELIDGAWYRYTHGLKRHQGLCQRIAHGHRSRLRIDVDGRRNRDLEAKWAAGWQDIYLASREDLAGEANGLCHFSYVAQEGLFELSLPSHRCALMESETTVEQIAQFIADQQASQHPGSSVEVRAYEGVAKGAIGRRG